jgi:hypothetical protein
MSPRTAKYVEAMVREDFNYEEWLKKVREQETQAKVAEATGSSGDLSLSVIDLPTGTPDGHPNPLLRLATKTIPRTLRLQCHPKSKIPQPRLKRWLEKIHRASGECQRSRARDAIYGYLEAVFAIVMHYKVRRRATRLLRHAFEFATLPFNKNADSFTAVIRCTSERDIDNKTVSKYARALRYAARRKKPDMRLKKFMKKAGGVNACAHLYAKHFGRGHTVSRLKLR